jgi:hypothetical protein
MKIKIPFPSNLSIKILLLKYSSKDFVDKLVNHHVPIDVNDEHVHIVSRVPAWHHRVAHVVHLVTILLAVVAVICV